MAEHCQSPAGILTYFKEIWQDYAEKIPYLCAVRNLRGSLNIFPRIKSFFDNSFAAPSATVPSDDHENTAQ